MSVNAMGETSVLSASGVNVQNILHTKEENNTAMEGYSANRESNSNATVINNTRTVGRDRPDSSAMGRTEQGGVSKSTGDKTALDGDTVTYGTDPNDMQVSFF
jgi:hypothetical protein